MAMARRVLTGANQVRKAAGMLPSVASRPLATELRKTELHDFHVARNAKMVDFAGFSMPLNYDDSIMDSARHCRSGCSVFDVSHMCGVSFKCALP
jgi:aminomethyltransferase